MDETVKTKVEDKVRLNVGLIGAGNAGGQFVDAAFRAGYLATELFCVNSSLKDMGDGVMANSIKSFMVGNSGRGAGLNRSVAKELFKENINVLVDMPEFKHLCDNNDIIVVGTSCSGGTGSGVSPILVKYIKQAYPQKIVIFYGILPRMSASSVELSNAMSCLNEIEAMNKGDNPLGIPYYLVDLNYYNDLSTEQAYPKVIEKMIGDLDVICGKYLNPSQYRMIDENDMRVVISAPGYSSIYRIENITQQSLDRKPLHDQMIDLIKHSPAIPIARDKLVDEMAFISNMPADFSDTVKSGDYSKITDYVGKPLSIFENYAVTQDGNGQFIMMATGQSYPVGHMSQINEILKSNAAERKAKMEARKSFDTDATSTYGFFQQGSRSTSSLLDKDTSPSTEETDKKTAILDGLFD